MSKPLFVTQAIYGLEQGGFQKLCNHYLFTRFGGELHSPGTLEDKNKTRKGKPDTYLVLDDGSYVLIECTTLNPVPKPKFKKKLEDDLQDCLQFEKLDITASQVRAIVLCCNSTLEFKLREHLRKMAAPSGVKLLFVSIEMLSEHFYSNDKEYSRDFLGIPFETGQVLTKADFLKEYRVKDFATPLDTVLIGREAELAQLVKNITDFDITVVMGAAGVGKSRLALQAIDQFVSENFEYEPLYIFYKPESIVEDIFSHLSPEGHYILLIDDANRQLQNFIAVLSRLVGSGITIKIVATVRDYAKEAVLKPIHNLNFTGMSIAPLSNDLIECILLAAPYEVRNWRLREQIVDIAKGNPRLAIMGANAVKDKPDTFKLTGVVAIFDEYFQSLIRDQSVFNDPLTLKALGLIAFFNTIDLEDDGDIQRLERFGIAQDDFIRTVNMLERLEVVQVEFNSVVKISEQNLSSYFFYLAFIKKGYFRTDEVLRDYYDTHNWRVRDTYLAAINIFGEQAILATQRKYFLDYIALISGSREKLIQFFDVFGLFFSNQLFGFIRSEIDRTALSGEPYDFQNAYKNAQSQNHDPVLRLLEPYYALMDLRFFAALDLGLQYVHKQRSLLDTLLSQVKSAFHPFYEDAVKGYPKLASLYAFLYSRIHDEASLVIFYYGMGHGLLNSSYGNEVYMQTAEGITFRSDFAELRNQFIQTLGSHYQQHRVTIYDLLMNYLEERGPDVAFGLSCDQPAINGFLLSQFDPADFEECYFISEYADWLSDRGVALLPELKQVKRRIANNDFLTYRILYSDRNKLKKQFLDYLDPYKEMQAREKFIRESIVITDLTGFKTVNKAVETAFDFKYWYLKNIGFNFELVIENIFKYELNLGFRSLGHYLERGNKVGLNGTRLFNIVFALAPALSGRMFNLLNRYVFKYRQSWLQEFFYCLPAEEMNDQMADEFLKCLRSAASEFDLYLFNFEKYERFRPGFVRDVLLILTGRRDNDPEFRYKLQPKFFESLPSLRDQDFELCKKIYFQQDLLNYNFDYKTLELYYLMEKDVRIFSELIDRRIALLKEHFSTPKLLLNEIWNFPESEQLVYESLVKLSQVERWNRVEGFSGLFFIRLPEAHNPKAWTVIERLITEFKDERHMLSILWNVLRNYLKPFYQHAIITWLRLNPSFDTFRKCEWNNTSFSYSSERQVWADYKIIELREVYAAVMQMPEPYLYIEHKEFLEKMIALEKRSGDWDRKMYYRGFR